MGFTRLSVYSFQLNKELHQRFPHSKIFMDPKALALYLECILVNRGSGASGTVPDTCLRVLHFLIK